MTFPNIGPADGSCDPEDLIQVIEQLDPAARLLPAERLPP